MTWTGKYPLQRAVMALTGLTGAARRATGSFELGSGRPAAMLVTQWFTDSVPRVDREAYRLQVRTPDGRTWSLTAGQLAAMQSVTQNQRCSTAPAAGGPNRPGAERDSTHPGRDATTRLHHRALGHRLHQTLRAQ